MTNSELSGSWSAEMYAEHLPESIAYDENLMKFILDHYQPRKALDLGCGLGYFVSYLREHGVDAWGVEAQDLSSQFKAPGYQIEKDLSQPFDLQEEYDLVVCLEVIEHIPREFENVVFDNIARHVKQYLLFSGATVGQYGTGHINERLESHWFSHLVRRGFTICHHDSVQLRSACTLPWYKQNASIWELTHPNRSDWAALIGERDSRIISFETNLQQQLSETQKQLEAKQIELEQTQAELRQAITKLTTLKDLILEHSLDTGE